MAFPIDEALILSAEQELGARFPDSYRAKMMASNGGVVLANEEAVFLHPLFDNTDRKRLKRTSNSVVRETLYARENYQLAVDHVIIGDAGNGDLLIYRIQSDGSMDPSVYYFNHETEKVSLIANDFNELQIES